MFVFVLLVSSYPTCLKTLKKSLEIVKTFFWDERHNLLRKNMEKLLRELQKSKIDGEEFIRLRRQIEDLRPY